MECQCNLVFGLLLFAYLLPYNPVSANEGEILGMSFSYEEEKKRIFYENDGTPCVIEGDELSMRVYGKLKKNFQIKFTSVPNLCGSSDFNSKTYKGKVEGKESEDGFYTTGTLEIKIPKRIEFRHMYLCLANDTGQFVFQDNSPWMKMKVVESSIAAWILIICIPILLLLSGILTSLNLGLMSLNKTELKILMKVGEDGEKEYAKRIYPVREHGNYLLCSIIVSGVIANSTLTIFIEELSSGTISIVLSTILIVMFGEIFPQALGFRYGLAIGAKFIYVTKLCMILTFPVAYPVGKLLDKLLGEEIGSVYTRERLKELLKVTKDYHGLGTDEVGIISGALDLKTKTVKDIMTSIEFVYMLPVDAVLDYDTLADIEYNGFSRIPVYERERSNIVSLVYVKQLTLLDADDKIPLKTIIEYYHNEMFYVMENTPLDQIFKTFREGSRGHMAFIQKVNNDGPGDPYYQIVGVVTLEDVLEEILQTEILDETDVGKYEAKINHTRSMKEPSYFKRKLKPRVEISPALVLAAAQYLATSVEAFKGEKISIQIIKRMITGSVAFFKAPKNYLHDQGANSEKVLLVYEKGVPSEYFTLILEGRVKVEVGNEKMVYEAGPFSSFGNEYLLSETRRSSSGAIGESVVAPSHFLPDYTISVLSDVYCVRLKYSGYKAALLATNIEKEHKEPEGTNWEDEIEKVLEEGVDSSQIN